jgi:hypothetical protein
MTTIMVLAEKLLVNSSHDPHVGFLMLMSGLTDVYHSAFGNPNRTVQ